MFDKALKTPITHKLALLIENKTAWHVANTLTQNKWRCYEYPTTTTKLA